MVRGGGTIPAALPLLLIFILIPIFFLIIGLSVGHALGFSPIVTMLLFYAILVGSVINIPVYERKVKLKVQSRKVSVLGIEYRLPDWTTSRCVVAVNVGGCLIPLALCVYFLLDLPITQTLIAIIAVTVACYILARPITHVGIAVPMFVPVVVTIVTAWAVCTLLGGMSDLPRISFTAGVVGTIVGADIFHLRDIGDVVARVVSIGGAGTFDGIFLTGVLATLLSGLIVN
jgi:uncharacterized membrane protein